MQKKYVKPFAVCRIVQGSDFAYFAYVCTPHFADADTLYVLAHTRTYRVHTEYDHALWWTVYVLGHTCKCQYKSVHTSSYWTVSKVKSTYGVCTKSILYIHCMYFVCTVFVQCSYSVCTDYYRACSKMSLYIQASSFSEQFESSLYWVHTLFISTLDWKRPSSIFQINQSIHSNHHAFGFAPLPFAGGTAAGCGRRIGRPRVRAGRAGRAGLRRSATAPAALASAAALDPAAKPKERRNDLPNSLDNPSCSDGSVVVKDVARCAVVMLTLQRR